MVGGAGIFRLDELSCCGRLSARRILGENTVKQPCRMAGLLL